MREKRLKRKALKPIFKQLDALYTICRNTAREWDKKTIPLTMFKLYIDKSKVSENTGFEAVDLHNSKYNSCLDKFYSECDKIAYEMNSKDIPIITIKTGINIIKKGYKDGQ